MTKKKRPDRRLIIVSQRRTPSDEGLARLVAAMVQHQIRQQRTDDVQRPARQKVDTL